MGWLGSMGSPWCNPASGSPDLLPLRLHDRTSSSQGRSKAIHGHRLGGSRQSEVHGSSDAAELPEHPTAVWTECRLLRRQSVWKQHPVSTTSRSTSPVEWTVCAAEWTTSCARQVDTPSDDEPDICEKQFRLQELPDMAFMGGDQVSTALLCMMMKHDDTLQYKKRTE